MTQSQRSTILGHRGLWTAEIGYVVLIVVFVAVVALVAPNLPETLSGGALVVAGLALALIPAIIWLAFFYQQDRLEPEPKHHILQVFVLGALVAKAIGIPLLGGLFSVNQWLYRDALTHLLGSILVVGLVQEFLKFAAVRFSIYSSREFNERVDGVIYATAAGIGFATMLNFDYVISRNGVDLTVGAMRIAVTALAHASIAGIMGYFLGQTKFEHTPIYYLPGGLLLAAALNGLFFWAQDVITVQGLSFNPLWGMALAVVVAVVVLAIVFWLIRRAQAETVTLAQAGGEA